MSADQLPPGYIYRVERANRDQLATIVETYVGASGWTFAGAALWDFESKRGRENLRPMVKFPTEGALDLKGDFGHAFNKEAEVRWKRRDEGDYDVLILSENPLSEGQRAADGAELLRIEDKDWRIRRYEKAAIVLAENHPAIRYIDYLAPNGAAQFQRLVEVQP